MRKKSTEPHVAEKNCGYNSEHIGPIVLTENGPTSVNFKILMWVRLLLNILLYALTHNDSYRMSNTADNNIHLETFLPIYLHSDILVLA